MSSIGHQHEIEAIHLQMEFLVRLSVVKLTKAEKAHLHTHTPEKTVMNLSLSLIEKCPPEREKESQPLEPISHTP